MVWDELTSTWTYPVVTLEQFAQFVGTDFNRLTDKDTVNMQRSLDAAEAYLQYVLEGVKPTRPVPEAIYVSVLFNEAAQWGKRKDNGTVQKQDYNAGSIYPVRGAKDPLEFDYPILRRYLGVNFA